MKKLTPVVLVAGLVSAQAQAVGIPELLMPSPIAIVIQVGKWIKSQENPVYKIRVQATGVDEEQARTQAFKLAVDEAIGSVVVSESQINKDSLQSHDVINYSSGYVSDFEIVSRQTVPDGIQLTLDVEVTGLDLAERAFNKSKDGVTINGDKVLHSANSLRHEQKQGDKLLQQVTDDYPSKSFDIQTSTVEFLSTPNRKLQVKVAFVLSWNPQYVQSLHTTVEKVGVISSDYPSFIIKARPGKNGWTRKFGFDSHRWQILYNAMITSRPGVLLDLQDGNANTLLKKCYYFNQLDLSESYYISPNPLLQTQGQSLQINTYNNLQAKIHLPISDQLLEQSRFVKLSVVREKHCY